LRSKLSIIPQTPVLFSGTLRENLDPLNLFDDNEIWAALQKCHLLDTLTNQIRNGLDSEIAERGINFSVGQKQLLCLARAILNKSKILCIDEATASIDQHTDNLIQQTIRREFPNSTTLTIAHRFATILDSNRILVVDKGIVKEFDTPQNLQNNKNALSPHYHHNNSHHYINKSCKNLQNNNNCNNCIFITELSLHQ